MNDTTTNNELPTSTDNEVISLTPLGGAPVSPAPLNSVSGDDSVAYVSQPVQRAAALGAPVGASHFAVSPNASPPGAGSSRLAIAGASRFGATSVSGPVRVRRGDMASARATDEPSAALTVGALVAGLLVGAACFFAWRWVSQAVHFDTSLFSIVLGLAVGFAMSLVAKKESELITLSAALLAAGFCVAGTWHNLGSDKLMPILFGALCVVLGAGAAARAATANPDAV